MSQKAFFSNLPLTMSSFSIFFFFYSSFVCVCVWWGGGGVGGRCVCAGGGERHWRAMSDAYEKFHQSLISL